MNHLQTATEEVTSGGRLSLADDATTRSLLRGPAAKLPSINVFRTLANASSLAPDYMRYFARLFEPMELDSRIERLVVLLTGKLSGCEYIWRQNSVVARSLGIPDEQVAALHDGNLEAPCFTAAHKAAFRFAKEVLELIEVTDETYATAEKYFSHRALTEILYVVGSYMFLARLIRTGHVPMDEQPAEVPPGALS